MCRKPPSIMFHHLVEPLDPFCWFPSGRVWLKIPKKPLEFGHVKFASIQLWGHGLDLHPHMLAQSDDSKSWKVWHWFPPMFIMSRLGPSLSIAQSNLKQQGKDALLARHPFQRLVCWSQIGVSDNHFEHPTLSTSKKKAHFEHDRGGGSINGGVPGVPQNRWLVMEHPIETGWFRSSHPTHHPHGASSAGALHGASGPL